MSEKLVWYALFPGSGIPVTVPGNNEKEVREYLRKWHGVKRLPRGVEIWSSTQESVNFIVRENVRNGFSGLYS